jgi:putative ABC transport system permease protein
MLRHYTKIAMRNLSRHIGYSLINVFGLAIGMATCILILLFIQSELSYDQFHEKKDRIYRLGIEWRNGNAGEPLAMSKGPFRLADAVRTDFPELEHVVRLYPLDRTSFRLGDRQFSENRFFFVDPDFFEVFGFKLLSGDQSTALRDPYTMVISETTANRYFGDSNPVGKTLEWRDKQMTVTGVVEDPPENSHFHFDFLASLTVAQQEFEPPVLENWGEGTSFTYLVFPVGVNPTGVEAEFPGFVEKNVQEGASERLRLWLMPLTDIHLYAHTDWEIEQNGDMSYVYSFAIIAVFILLIACINFMNLATARAARRSKEVGLRKVVGAARVQLITQFLGEVIILAMAGLALAIIFVLAVLPVFNEFVERELSLNPMENGMLLLMLAGIVLFVGLAAGAYPAFFLSSLSPVKVLKGALAQGGGAILRKSLVTFQFGVSILLLVVTLIVYNQLQYNRNIELGYDKEHVVVIPDVPRALRANYQQLSQELMDHPNILLAAAASRVPPGKLDSDIGTRPEGVPEEERRGMKTIWTDFDYMELLDLDMAAGRTFSRDYPTDATAGFVLNEAAVRSLGWTAEEAIGKGFGSREVTALSDGRWVPRDGQVIGVVKDFHFESLHEAISPNVYFVAPLMAWNYLIRISPERIPETLSAIESTWQKFSPDAPIDYRFLDESFDSLYRAEERQMTLFGIFSSLAIFIGCLGLTGLASYTAQQKTKEIGVRKVLGASESGIVMLLSGEFAKLVILANLLAWPVAYYFMQNWLQGFVYRVELSVFTFLVPGIAALLFAGITVGFQALRAARMNPVQALHYE